MLAETVRQVDEIVAAAQATGRVPSLVAAIVRDGAPVHVAGAGEVPPPDPDLQYRIGSISKTFTAALILQLRDEDRLSLDDLLYRHLPGTPVGGVTIRQLLGHVSGLQREPEGEWWERSPGLPVDKFLAELTPDKAAYPPLRTFHYSNLAYGLLGAVAERITGESWSAQVGKRFLDPLGMTRTTYQATEPFARGYVVHPWHGTLREEPRHDAGAMAPAGQLWSTAADLSTWAAFLADPVPAVLSPASVAQMCAPVAMGDLESWTSGQGLGLQLWRRGERVYVGHTGSMPGYLAVLAVHRPSRTGVVAFANAYTLVGGSLGALGLRLLSTVLDSEPPRITPWRPGTAPPAEVEPLTGRWWWMGREFEVAWDGELLMYPLADRSAVWRFTPDGTDRWRCHTGMNDGEVLTVQRAPSGAVAALDVATFVFTREPGRPGP
jgi:CubicO group peptidase (beta-lactamase class C family)